MEVKSPNERKRKIIQLERLLESMIAIEEYELCIQLRDIINRMKYGMEKESGKNIYKRIWELKTKAMIEDVKTQIQKLQQSIDKKG